MNTYYVTFGVKYSQQLHKVGAWVDPNGYLVVFAPDETAARHMTIGSFGMDWAFIYEEEPDARKYEMGPLAFLSRAGLNISTLGLAWGKKRAEKFKYSWEEDDG